MKKQQLIEAIVSLDSDHSANVLKGKTNPQLKAILKGLQDEQEKIAQVAKANVDVVLNLRQASELEDKKSILYNEIIGVCKDANIKWSDISDYLRDNFLQQVTAINPDGEEYIAEWPSKTLKDGTEKPVGIGAASKDHKYQGAIWLNRFNNYRSTHFADYGLTWADKKEREAGTSAAKAGAGGKTATTEKTRNEAATDNKTSKGVKVNRDSIPITILLMLEDFNKLTDQAEKELLLDSLQDIAAFYKVKLAA